MDIYGQKVRIRALEPEDMEMLRETTNDPGTERLIAGWSFPVSKGEQMKWYESVVADKVNKRFAIEVLETGEAVGMISLTNINWKNRSAFHAIRLGSNVPKGKGIGTDAVMAIMRYAFDELQMVRLDGAWVEYNERSLGMYKKCGWKVEGVKEKAKYHNGKYYSVLIGGILREDYEEAKKRLNWAPASDNI